MTAYEEAELAGRIQLATQKALDAAGRHDWQTFDQQMERVAVLRANLPISEARTIGIVALKEATTPGATKVKIGIEKDNLALILHPEGTGTWEGDYDPILLERHEGAIRLIVWSDINDHEATHVIDLSGALETNRKSAMTDTD